MARPKRLYKPSTLINDLWGIADERGFITLDDVTEVYEGAKRYERRKKRELALARGKDPANN